MLLGARGGRGRWCERDLGLWLSLLCGEWRGRRLRNHVRCLVDVSIDLCWTAWYLPRFAPVMRIVVDCDMAGSGRRKDYGRYTVLDINNSYERKERRRSEIMR
jgi:hypothetical protein